MSKKCQNLKTVRKLATQLYVAGLVERSGGLSLGLIEKTFKKSHKIPNKQYWESYSRTFYKYARGESCIKDQSLILHIDKYEAYRGVKEVLNHPLWLILENPDASLHDVHAYMHQLKPSFQQRLFKLDKNINTLTRKYWSHTDQLSRISMENNLDALACLIMLLREMELLNKWHAYVKVKWEVHFLFLRLSYFDPLLSIREVLYHFMDTYFFDKHRFITERYFPATRQLMYTHFRHAFKSPQCINDFTGYDEINAELLKYAYQLSIKTDTKETKLIFLFWVVEFGLTNIVKAFECSPPDSDSLLQRLTKACTSTNTRKYLKHSYILEF
ncbi:hypothetical protein [Paraglaciecola sp.]|uniref:hypothetical protein n=1 Tax=Paraglaciecola sp. TaxID=1920173 RepID=UPI003266E44A